LISCWTEPSSLTSVPLVLEYEEVLLREADALGVTPREFLAQMYNSP
jgi:hypothetical protein